MPVAVLWKSFFRRVGLERTGLLGMFLLVSCSSLALLSVFLPGSPMDLTVIWQDNNNTR